MYVSGVPCKVSLWARKLHLKVASRGSKSPGSVLGFGKATGMALRSLPIGRIGEITQTSQVEVVYEAGQKQVYSCECAERSVHSCIIY